MRNSEHWVDHVAQDLRYTLRSLRRRPGFSLALILIFAIAIGMNTALFSVFNAVLLRPLSYPNAERLVWLSTIVEEGEPGVVSGPQFNDWRAQAPSLERMVAYAQLDGTLASPQGLTRARVAAVTHDFWELSGAVPTSGRLPQLDERGVVVATQAFVVRQLGNVFNVVGSTVTLDGRPVTIVGILSHEFRPQLPRSPFPGFRTREIDLYRPMFVSTARDGPVQLFNVIARLKPNATLAGARTEIETIRRRSAELQPNRFYDQGRLRIVPLHDQVAGNARIVLQVLLGAVGFVLLIACANASSMFLVRASARGTELAIRLSLGVGQGRLFAQMMIECLLLVAAGSAAGLLVAGIALESIRRIDAYAIPRLTEATFDLRVMGALLVASLLTALMCGFVPAIAAWRTDLQKALKRGVATTSTSLERLRTASVLVAAEVALALVLLIGAGLMLKTVWLMNQHPSGFEPHRVLTARLEFSGPGRVDPHRMVVFADLLVGRLNSEPWVAAASISSHGYGLSQALNVDGRPRRRDDDPVAARSPIFINSTSSSLREVMGLRLVRGRWFEDDEAAAVLNESLASREFAAEDALGRRLRVSDDGPWLTIVGIIADRKFSQLDAPPEPEVYVPYRVAGDGLFGFTALVLTNGDARAHAATFRQVVTAVDSTQVPDEVITLEQALSQSIAPRRLNVLLLGAFAAAALILAIVGVYGVMSFAVSQRVREYGVRMALGAQRSQVVRMVLRQGMLVVSFGVAAGIAMCALLTRAIQALLYGVHATDFPTFAVGISALLSTAVLACAIPALRAARVEPMVALCDE